MAAIDTSNWIRVAGYAAVAALVLVARGRERHRATRDDGAWPAFWWLTAALLATMALARAANVGDLITEVGRAEAIRGGWYASRRGTQAAVIGAVGLTWAVTVGVACWRVPPRRRRYLPMMVVIVTLAAFAAIRLVSLHQVDSLLHRRHIAGVRVGTLIECSLLAIAALVTGWVPRSDERSSLPGALDVSPV